MCDDGYDLVYEIGTTFWWRCENGEWSQRSKCEGNKQCKQTFGVTSDNITYLNIYMHFEYLSTSRN